MFQFINGQENDDTNCKFSFIHLNQPIQPTHPELLIHPIYTDQPTQHTQHTQHTQSNINIKKYDNSQYNILSTNLHNYFGKKSPDIYFSSGYSLFNLLVILYGASSGKTKQLFENEIKLNNKSLTQLTDNILVMNNSNTYKQINLILCDSLDNTKYFDSISQICKLEKLKGNIENINIFVKRYTNGLIEKAIDSTFNLIDVDMILMNIIYFKSNWKHQFNKNNTIEKQFNGINNKIVKMMSQTVSHPYAENNIYQLLEMDYADNIYSMGLILPKEHNNLKIDYNNLMSLIDNIHETKINIELPKFKKAIKLKLNTAVANMGLKQIFEQIEVPKLMKQNSYIQDIIQKIVIDVNEEGTEMAIVTSISKCFNCIERSDQPIDFICDRPFMFYIRNKQTNIIICFGTYM